MQWGPVSSASSIHDSSSSVITSSEGGVPSLKNQTDFLEGRDLSDQQMDKVLHVRSCAKFTNWKPNLQTGRFYGVYYGIIRINKILWAPVNKK